MFKRIELKPRLGLFLLKDGVFINFKDININYRSKDIIGYCVGNNRIMSLDYKNKFEWSTRYESIPGLMSLPSTSSISNIVSDDPTSCDNGRYNTDLIINYCRKNNLNLQNDYPAFYYCKSYSPGFHDGEWYLPSIEELINAFNSLHSSYELYNISIWSSSVNTNEYVSWRLLRGRPVCADRHSNLHVIPFLKV